MSKGELFLPRRACGSQEDTEDLLAVVDEKCDRLES